MFGSTLHLGTFNVEALKALAPNDVTVYADGDSWEVWGEDEDQAACAMHPRHVMFTGKSSAELLADLSWVMQESGNLLVPMTYENQAGTLATITPHDDWSEPYFYLTDRPAQDFLRRGFWDGVSADALRARNESRAHAENLHGSPEPWLWSGWREYLYLENEEPREG